MMEPNPQSYDKGTNYTYVKLNHMLLSYALSNLENLTYKEFIKVDEGLETAERKDELQGVFCMARNNYYQGISETFNSLSDKYGLVTKGDLRGEALCLQETLNVLDLSLNQLEGLMDLSTVENRKAYDMKAKFTELLCEKTKEYQTLIDQKKEEAEKLEKEIEEEFKSYFSF
ncbi:MAG: hypothetical protein MJ252_06370 [archaeon]|nr:hypothetical protein [archaeon]